MSVISCEVPDFLKERLHDKLAESKALDAIDGRVKQGMCAAIEHLRGNKSPNPLFKDLGFQKPPNEIQSLQVVYKYLASVNLTWTLETLSQETNVQIDATEEIPSLIDLLQYPGGKPPRDDEPVEEGEVQGEGEGEGDGDGDGEVEEEEDSSEATELDQEEEDTE